jgi:hypothetical protein
VKPQRSITSNSKAATTKRLMDDIIRNDEIVRAMLTPSPALPGLGLG